MMVASAGCATTRNGPSVTEIQDIRLGPGLQKEKEIYKDYSLKEHFAWPVRGPIISQFGARIDRTKNKGIDIRSEQGKAIRASRAGTVVFSDDKLKGFGKTIILDHGDSYQTVYAYNSEILARVGDRVARNDVIAKAGRTGRAKESSLHFEIRVNGEPRDPYYYLTQ